MTCLNQSFWGTNQASVEDKSRLPLCELLSAISRSCHLVWLTVRGQVRYDVLIQRCTHTYTFIPTSTHLHWCAVQISIPACKQKFLLQIIRLNLQKTEINACVHKHRQDVQAYICLRLFTLIQHLQPSKCCNAIWLRVCWKDKEKIFFLMVCVLFEHNKNPEKPSHLFKSN